MPVKSVQSININDSIKNRTVTLPKEQNDTISLCSDDQTPPVDTFETQTSKTDLTETTLKETTTPKTDENESSFPLKKLLLVIGGALLAGEILVYNGRHLKIGADFLYRSAKGTKAAIKYVRDVNASKIPFVKQDAIYQRASEFVESIPQTNVDEMIGKVFQRTENGMNPSLIGEIPKGILPKNGVYYHGTRHTSSVIKDGFSVAKSNQLHFASREFGAGVYLTPDRKVASNFAGFCGRVMPVKANLSRTAFVNESQYPNMLNSILNTNVGVSIPQEIVENVNFGNAVREMLIRRVFMNAGYDSVYTAKSMASGEIFGQQAQSFDRIIGRAQSQLVIFDPSKLTIMPKTLKRKMYDELMQIKSTAVVYYNSYKDAFKAYKDMYAQIFKVSAGKIQSGQT